MTAPWSGDIHQRGTWQRLSRGSYRLRGHCLWWDDTLEFRGRAFGDCAWLIMGCWGRNQRWERAGSWSGGGKETLKVEIKRINGTSWRSAGAGQCSLSCLLIKLNFWLFYWLWGTLFCVQVCVWGVRVPATGAGPWVRGTICLCCHKQSTWGCVSHCVIASKHQDWQPVGQIKTWESSIGAAIGLNWVLETAEGLCIGCLRGQRSGAGYQKDSGSVVGLLQSAKSGPATRKTSLHVCVCVGTRQCGSQWSQGPAAGCIGFLRPNTGGIHRVVSLCTCMFV